jgi:hypothetical protein
MSRRPAPVTRPGPTGQVRWLFQQKMEVALQNGSSWLDSSDAHKSVQIDLVDGVSTLSLALDKASPGQVRFEINDEERNVTIGEFMSEVIPSLSLEIERIGMRKWKSIESNNIRSESSYELVFETTSNERQRKDHDDLAKYADLKRRLFKKIFPVWQKVASGTRQTTWTSGQSSDCLRFFCTWLICVEPTGSRAQFFLDASEPDMTQDLDTNYLEYTDSDDGDPAEYYLTGDDLPNPMALACFRERWPSLTTASCGNGDS